MSALLARLVQLEPRALQAPQAPLALQDPQASQAPLVQPAPLALLVLPLLAV